MIDQHPLNPRLGSNFDEFAAKHSEELAKQNVRLREVLENILYAYMGGHITTIAIGGGLDQGAAVLDQARAALEGK